MDKCRDNIVHTSLEKDDITQQHIDAGIYRCYMYPCKYCVKPDENKLVYAIYHLQVAKVKTIMDNMTSDEIYNYRKNKYNIDIGSFNHNLLEFIYFELLSIGWDRFESMSPLSFMDFRSNCVLTPPVKKTLDIIEYISSKCPKLITTELIKKYMTFRCQPIVNILCNYYSEVHTDNDNSCYLCMSDYRCDLIKTPCKCKMQIHIECLIQYIEKVNTRCMTCKSDIEHFNSNGRIIFPKLNIYRMPLVNIYKVIDKDDKTESLRYAIIYLQTERVKDVLNSMSSDEYKIFLETVDRYGLLTINPLNNNIKLCDVLFSNLPRRNYAKEFKEIEDELERKKAKQEEVC